MRASLWCGVPYVPTLFRVHVRRYTFVGTCNYLLPSYSRDPDMYIHRHCTYIQVVVVAGRTQDSGDSRFKGVGRLQAHWLITHRSAKPGQALPRGRILLRDTGVGRAAGDCNCCSDGAMLLGYFSCYVSIQAHPLTSCNKQG